jgi:transposase
MEKKIGRRSFDEQFKRDAVRMVMEGGQKISQISRDLGVGVTQLRYWEQQYGGGTGKVKTGEVAELEQLRRELAQVKEEREILKKALAVFSRRPG